MDKFFLYEHPAGAGAWRLDVVESGARRPGVQQIAGGMCMFGMTQSDERGMGYIKKPTTFMTNNNLFMYLSADSRPDLQDAPVGQAPKAPTKDS